jgi:uncharacterized lipoprotein YddW (UPF0748 family)
MKFKAIIAVVAVSACSHTDPAPEPAPIVIESNAETPAALPDIPAMPREARGVWVATVGNMDWPSKRGLPADSQKAELIRILDRVQALRMNLVILQVRVAGDALYASSLEPWSEYLSGEMGKAPEPFYDPLAFAVAVAHARGLELHAWFNPFRARHTSARGEAAATHLIKARPDLVRTYGTHKWFDPGEPEVQDHSLRVILDVVKRYDIDGVHIDDYFYPYREYEKGGKLIDFPDEKSWNRYVDRGGMLSRADWRRSNVDHFVQRLNHAVHTEKPWLKFGVSPFGIWRPGYPASVVGLDSFVEIYADSRKWLNNGWLDYFVPQLYWMTDAPQQRYTDLLEWWVAENNHKRHIWAGNAAFRVRADRQNWPAGEITRQIALTRENEGATGNIQFNMKALLRNQGGVADAMLADAYTYDALMPRSPWLDDVPPPAPEIRLLGSNLDIIAANGEKPAVFTVRMKLGNGWLAETIPASQARYSIARSPAGALPELVAVTAVDRNGNESAPVTVWVSGRARS